MTLERSYVPVGGGLYEKVDKWDGRVPVTTGELIDEETYEDLCKKVESRSASPEVKTSSSTGIASLGKMAAVNSVKISI